jgi:hypothetical protein
MSYCVYLASSTPVKVVPGSFLSLGGWLLVDRVCV